MYSEKRRVLKVYNLLYFLSFLLSLNLIPESYYASKCSVQNTEKPVTKNR